MGKLFVLALLLGVWWGLERGLVPMPAALSPDSPAWEAYTSFSEYLAHDSYGNASRMATRGAVRAVQIRELRGRRNIKLGISGRKISKDEIERSHKGEIRGVGHTRISEIESQDGKTVTIQAVQRVCRDGTGCEEKQHDVEICLTEQEWKVCSFRESAAPAGELAAR